MDSVRAEERQFGGDIAWWVLLLVVSLPVALLGIAQIPQTSGFVLLSVGGILGGLAFAMIIVRLPYFTNGFVVSVLIVVAVSAVIGGTAFLFNAALPVPTPPPDVMYKPPVSGG